MFKASNRSLQRYPIFTLWGRCYKLNNLNVLYSFHILDSLQGARGNNAKEHGGSNEGINRREGKREMNSMQQIMYG